MASYRKRVTKTRGLINLYGESRKQEKKRLDKEQIKAILKGKDTNIRMDKGTTKSQRDARRNILKKRGLSTKVKRYKDFYKTRRKKNSGLATALKNASLS